MKKYIQSFDSENVIIERIISNLAFNIYSCSKYNTVNFFLRKTIHHIEPYLHLDADNLV